MHPNTYKIRLLFIHKNLNFTETRNALNSISGIHISTPHNAGEDGYDVRGTKLEGQYRDSRLGVDFETGKSWNKSEQKDSRDAVDEILEQLRPHKDMLTDLADKDCYLSVIVSISVNENTSVNIDPELAKKLVEFNMNLSYDLYPPDLVQ